MRLYCHTSRARAAKPSRVSAAITHRAASDNRILLRLPCLPFSPFLLLPDFHRILRGPFKPGSHYAPLDRCRTFWPVRHKGQRIVEDEFRLFAQDGIDRDIDRVRRFGEQLARNPNDQVEEATTFRDHLVLRRRPKHGYTFRVKVGHSAERRSGPSNLEPDSD